MTENAFIAAARTGQNGFWRYLGTIVLIITLTLGPTTCLVSALFIIYRTADILSVMPGYLFLAVNLAGFVLIPLCLWIGLRFLHRRSLMSIINPSGRLNGLRFLAGAGAWLLLAAAGDLVLALLQPGNYHWTFNLLAFLPYLVVALIFIPIQSGAEEMLFRGYLTQGFGLINFWLGWLVPALMFGLLHGFNPEVGTYGMLATMPIYIGMGLLLGWVTLRSQSLEIAMGMHIANNLYSSLVVTFPSSALQTESLFRIERFDALAALVVFAITALVFIAGFEWLWHRRGRSTVPVTGLLIMVLVLNSCSLVKSSTTDETPAAQESENLNASETPSALETLSESGTPQAANLPSIGELILEDCRLEGSQVKAMCGDLEVPENRALPEGRKIKIHVVVVKAVSRTPEPDPVFLLAGGPGQSAVESFSGLFGLFARIQEKRDIVMVDQRGTGESGALRCDEKPAETEPTPEPTPEVVDADLPLEDQLAEIDTCLASFQDVDLTQYTTDIAMQDLDDVRYALGYETINLLGISYGTRAALTYLSLYPGRVRSLVLDGVAPLGWAIGATMRADAERALDLIISRCQRNTDCNQQFPDLKRKLVDLLASTGDQPVEITVPDPHTAEPRVVRVSPLMISATVRLMTYSDNQSALIPLMIDQAAQGDFSLIASQYIQWTSSVSGSISYGMYYSVWCYEDLPKIPKGGELGEFYFDPQMEASRAVCERWPQINRSVDMPAYPNNDVPVLLISGEADPVTPPANAELIHQQFPQSLSLVLPDMGHNNTFSGCVPEIVRDFINMASVEDLDIACLQDITPQSFFLSPAGPTPRK